MESWRSFLLEDARNQETGIISAGYMRLFINTIKKIFEDPLSSEMGVSISTVSTELSGDVIDETIKGYINKSGAKNSKFIKRIKKFSLQTENGKEEEYDPALEEMVPVPFMLRPFGGFWNSEKGIFNIKVRIDGKFDTEVLKNNFIYIKNLKSDLQKFVQHEIEHVAQDLRGDPMQQNIEAGDIASGKTKKDERVVRKLYDLFFKPKPTDFEKKLDEAKDILNYLNSKYGSENDATKIITYYLQPAEIEAYTAGFMRNVKLTVQNAIRKGTVEKSQKSKLERELFLKKIRDHIKQLESGFDDSTLFNSELKNYVDDVHKKMIENAYERYGNMRK